MLRHTLVYMYVFGFGLYAFKDWYKSLCALILMMGAVRHPDMPRTLLEIQGLTPWNILLVFVFLGFVANKASEKLTWDMPRNITNLLLIYFIIVMLSSIRMVRDPSGIIEWATITGQREIPTMKTFVSEYFINPIKWVIPGILLFYGCRTRRRFVMAACSIIGLYFIYAIQIIKWMPLGMVLGGGDLARRAGKILQNEIGINRDTLSIMMAGAFWAALQLRNLVKSGIPILIVRLSNGLIFLAQALTAGRAGYVAWIVCGCFMGLLRYKKYLIMVSILLILIVNVVPAVKDRMFTGFETSPSHEVSELEQQYTYYGINWYKVTSGRVVAWPYVIEKIIERPFWGYGRMAMQRAGISNYLWNNFRESFPHPHNLYLEFLLDNGFLGFLPVILFYFLMTKYSYSLFRDKQNEIYIVSGGISFALVLAYLVGGIGTGYFYPVEESLGRWCAIFLMLRVYAERSKRKLRASEKLFGELQ